MADLTLEVEYIDPDDTPIVLKMFDETKITIGKNVKDFYLKLLKLPIDYPCQILKLDINELEKFIKEHQKHYNQKLISEFNKTWLWRLDGEVYNFQDKETNEMCFGLFLNKRQIISKLKRNTFNVSEVFKMLEYFKDNDDLKEYYKE